MVGLQAAELPSARRNGNYRHGYFTAEAKEQRLQLRLLIPGLRFRGFSRPAVFGALGQVLIIGSDIEHLLFEDRIGHALRHRARFLRTVAPVLWII
jgi:hypothetical protein